MADPHGDTGTVSFDEKDNVFTPMAESLNCLFAHGLWKSLQARQIARTRAATLL